jgi:hypothetical protein
LGAPRETAKLGAAGGETLRVTLDLHDISGQPIQDPEAFFTFRRVSGNRQIGDQLALELGVLIAEPVEDAISPEELRADVRAQLTPSGIFRV